MLKKEKRIIVKMPPLVRYFLVCGLESSAGLELDDSPSPGLSSSSSSDDNEFSNPLERAYKPRILRLFPEVDPASWANFNADGLCRLILPRGLRFCTQREVNEYGPRCHPFCATREDGEKTFGVALVFYEAVTDSNICHAVHTLQKMYSTETEGNGGGNGGASGSSQGSGTLRRSDRLLRPRSSGSSRTSSERSRSLPRHYQQSRLLSTSTLDLSGANYDYTRDTLYATKAVALVCAEPLVQAATTVLSAMHKYIGKSDFDLKVLEGLVYNLLHDIPVPSPGRSVRFWCLGDAVTVSMPRTPTELPLFDYDLLDFFDILGVENAVKLVVCALLEHQVSFN